MNNVDVCLFTTGSLLVFDCNGTFPQWIGVAEEDITGPIEEQFIITFPLDNGGISYLINPFYNEFNCLARLSAIQLAIYSNNIEPPTLQVIRWNKTVASDPVTFEKTSTGNLFITYELANDDDVKKTIGNKFSVVLPTDGTKILPVASSIGTDFTYNEDTFDGGLVPINYLMDSTYVLLKNWTEYSACNSSLTRESHRICYDFSAGIEVDSIKCNGTEYRYLECKPEWRDESLWSICKPLNGNICGIGSTYLSYQTCVDNVTNTELPIEYCGDKIFLDKQCYVICPDDHFWNKVKWQTHTQCTTFLPSEQGETPKLNNSNTLINEYESCGNGFETFIPSCQATNKLTGEVVTIPGDTCADMPPPIKTTSCYKICSDFVEDVCNSSTPLLPPVQVTKPFTDDDYLSKDFKVLTTINNGGYILNTNTEIIVSSDSGGHLDMILEYNKQIVLSSFYITFTLLSDAIDVLSLNISIGNNDFFIDISHANKSSEFIKDITFCQNILLSSIRFYTEGIAPSYSMSYKFKIDVSNGCEPGTWGEWTSWNTCNVNNCSVGGMWNRTRHCYKDTKSIESIDRRHCIGQFIDFDNCTCSYSPWSNWTECTVSCGEGKQNRTRQCLLSDISQCVELVEEIRNCTTPPCPVNGGYSEWSEWSEWSCSASCGGGVHARVRACNNPLPENGGTGCEALGEATESRKCNNYPCPVVNGGYSEWSRWSGCSAPCGGGAEARERACNNPLPENGGTGCEALGEATESRECNTYPCPVDGKYGAWGSWGSCSKTCEGGTKTRTRKCDSPAPANGGADCSGSASESKACNTQLCRVTTQSPTKPTTQSPTKPTTRSTVKTATKATTTKAKTATNKANNQDSNKLNEVTAGRSYSSQKKYTNKKLLSSRILRKFANTQASYICMYEYCEKTTGCYSINYNSKTKECELLGEKYNKGYHQLETREAWKYYEVDNN